METAQTASFANFLPAFDFKEEQITASYEHTVWSEMRKDEGAIVIVRGKSYTKQWYTLRILHYWMIIGREKMCHTHSLLLHVNNCHQQLLKQQRAFKFE